MAFFYILIGMQLMYLLIYLLADKEKIKTNDNIITSLGIYLIVGFLIVYPVLWKYSVLYSLIVTLFFPFIALMASLNIRKKKTLYDKDRK